MESNLKQLIENKKIIIIIAVAILFIVIFSVLGIKAAEAYNKKLIVQRREEFKARQAQNINSRKENIDSINNSEQSLQNMNIKRLPVYSEQAKKKMKTIYNNTDSTKKVVYLTFDDGPSQTVTPLILDLLKKEDIKATFFVLGKMVKLNPELVKREYEEGHYIANHGYSHEYGTIYKSVNSVISEFNRNEAEIQKAIGVKDYHSHLFRFPGGYWGGRYFSVKQKAAKELNKKDISFIDWNALTSDAAGANTKKKILSNLKSTVKGKSTVVLLMHDASGKILTYETLEDVIKYLREQGYTFDNFYSIMK